MLQTFIFQINCFLLNRKTNLAANQNFRMISEGKCDPEDWSKKCWKSSFASKELQKLHLKYNQIESSYFKL